MRTFGIDRTTNSPAARRRHSTPASNGPDFARWLSAAETEDLVPSADVNAPRALDSLLGVQEVGDEAARGRRRAAAAYGGAVLDRLERLRLDLLEGGASVAGLGALAHTLRAERRRSREPLLDDLLDEIELRAEVELAKLTRRA